MTKSFVIVAADLVKQLDHETGWRYRAYVNNELFTERTWIWNDRYYLEENLSIDAAPGQYPIEFTIHGAGPDAMQVQNLRIIEGPGRIEGNKLILDSE